MKTAEGIGVGSTFEDVATAYPGVKIQESPVQGSIIYLQDGDQWLGLAFAQQPRKVKDASKVVFIEAAEGDKPAAFLSGCGY